MKNLLRIASGVDVLPVVHAIQRQPDLWNAFPIRTTHPGSAHAQASDILVFFNDLARPEAIMESLDVEPFPAWSRLPQLRPIIFDLMRRVEATRLGRVVISRLPSGAQITPHADEGAPASYYERYQLCLQAGPGNVLSVGDERIEMAAGEVWWFDNQQVHSVANGGAIDRLALIIDARAG